MTLPTKFKFKQFDNVGCPAAEDDEGYLLKCFVDTGVLAELRNMTSARRILLARSGVGKSALLIQLKETEGKVITVKPESLALTHISNSTIIPYLENLGVKLEVFFRFLWKHVFAVEVFRAHFKVGDEPAKLTFLQYIQNALGVKKYKLALDYINTYGGSFWEDTEYRIKEIVHRFESDIKAQLGAKAAGIGLSVAERDALSQEERQEVVHKAQNVVNNIQMRNLSHILDLLNDVITSPAQRYFIVVDKLDENWVEDRLRYKLIRALIECVREFNKVRHVKIIIALRYDLMQKVFRDTREAGYQEEKYEGLYLHMQWNKEQLVEVLEKRINHLIQMTYTKQQVQCLDLFPKGPKKKEQFWIDYMLERTMMRPRDIILFFNECIKLATDQQKLSADIIRTAEREYSRGRLRSIGDEWVEQYPYLVNFLLVLKSKTPTLTLGEMDHKEIEEFCFNRVYEVETDKGIDDLIGWAQQVTDAKLTAAEFMKQVAAVFYRVGAVGIKKKHTGPC